MVERIRASGQAGERGSNPFLASQWEESLAGRGGVSTAFKTHAGLFRSRRRRKKKQKSEFPFSISWQLTIESFFSLFLFLGFVRGFQRWDLIFATYANCDHRYEGFSSGCVLPAPK